MDLKGEGTVYSGSAPGEYISLLPSLQKANHTGPASHTAQRPGKVWIWFWESFLEIPTERTHLANEKQVTA